MKTPFALKGGLVLWWLWSFSCASLGQRPGESIAGGDLVLSIRGRNPQQILLKLPRGHDDNRRYTLLVALHGNSGTPEGLSPAFQGFRKEQILVALPRGGYPTANGGHSWFYKTADRSLWEREDKLSVSRIADVITELSGLYPIGRVYVLGFSQGATLAYMTGLRHPELVAGVAAISGIMPGIDTEGAILHAADIEKAKGLRMFMARGSSDGLVDRKQLTSQFEYFVEKGYAVTLCEYQGGHVLTDEVLGKLREWLKE